VKPAPFEYHAPTSTDAALALLTELGDEARVIAGGQSLAPMLTMRLATFPHLVDITRVDELRGIERDDGHVRIRATTTDTAVERDPLVAAAVPLMAKATPWIAHFQIRNRGTVGGSLAHADPAAEYPAVAVALDATIELVSARGARSVPAADFFVGVWDTVHEPDELLVAARFPVWEGRCGFGVRELARRHGDYALAGAVAAVGLDAGGRIDRAALCLIAMGSTPLRAPAAEKGLIGTWPGELTPAEVGRLVLDGLDEPPGDLNAPSWYRARIGEAMAAAAWAAALEDLDV
jgi:carbon-monoxide dehydrogenase medium subunit